MTAPVEVGDVLAGKYKVERVIGAGGMGVVVAAQHQTLGERVAIKFLLPAALAQPEIVQRFLREGQAAARIRSEHVGRVFDVGTLDSGAPFLVMEYLDGGDLGSIVRDRGALAVPLAIDFVLQACEALAEAHALGIVHRDLKPANLFLSHRADGSPCVKVIDFGISKVGGFGGENVDVTKSAVMMGSPLFMAPEQMASAKEADCRSDIWSLGVILHVLIAGRPPFEGTTALGIYDQMLQGAPPLRTLVAEVPEGVERVVLKCLQKDRNLRFNNVAELVVALAPYAPSMARISVDRVVRVLTPTLDAAALAALQESSRLAASADEKPRISLAVTPTSATALGPGDASVLDHTEVAQSAIEAARSLSSPTAMGASVVSAPATKSGLSLGIFGIAAVAVAAIAAFVIWGGGSPTAPVGASSVPTTLPTAAPTLTETKPSEPTVVPQNDLLPSATPAASASSSAPPPSTAKAPSTAKPLPKAAPTPPPTSKTTADPFADPH